MCYQGEVGEVGGEGIPSKGKGVKGCKSPTSNLIVTMITGVVGSGKTLIAVSAAQAICSHDGNVLYISETLTRDSAEAMVGDDVKFGICNWDSITKHNELYYRKIRRVFIDKGHKLTTSEQNVLREKFADGTYVTLVQ